MSSKRRLHPIAIFSEVLRTVRQFVLPILFGIWFGSQHADSHQLLLDLLLTLVVVGYGFLKWLRFTYSIDATQIHLESGVLFRKDQYIKKSRIQSIQIETNIILRLFGLVQLKFDTAEPAKLGDHTLRVLSLHEAERIKNALGHGERQLVESIASDLATDQAKTYTLSAKDILIAGMLSSNIGIVIAGAFAIWSQIADYVPKRWLRLPEQITRHVSLAVWVELILILVLIFWAIAILTTFLQIGGFKLTASAAKWRIEKGIIQTRDKTIRPDRIQAVHIKEHILQQLFGYCSIYAECSGRVDDPTNEHGSVLIMPIIKKKKAAEWLADRCPEFSVPLALRPLPFRGVFYALSFPAVFLSIISAALHFFFPWGRFSWPVVLIILLYLSVAIRSTGFSSQSEKLIFRERIIARTTWITTKNHIQTFIWKQSWIQRLLNLCSCKVTIRAGGRVVRQIRHIDTHDAALLFYWFRAK